MRLVELASWLAIPVSLVCIVDDWFLRPRRHIAASATRVGSTLLRGLMLRVTRFLSGVFLTGLAEPLVGGD